jgi:flavin-dependent dehydrogenase
VERAADIFVVGGGPAGLAMAVAARQRGLEVSVADGGTPPLDKPCGEGLTPHGLCALQRIGVNLPPLETHRFRGIRFVDARTAVDATFPNGFGLGVRRTDLHRIMVEHAERAGVTCSRTLDRRCRRQQFSSTALVRARCRKTLRDEIWFSPALLG